MKKYFYSDGTNNFGPFTIEELKEKGITRETSVWFHELGEWKMAGTIQELNELFAYIPPPLQRQTNYNQQPISQTSTNNAIDIFVFLSIAYWFISNLAYFIIEKVIDDWWSNDLVTYFRIGTNIVFAAIPIVFALSVRNKTLKVIAIILAALLCIDKLYSNIDWLIRELK
jgi:hypothetical protein